MSDSIPNLFIVGAGKAGTYSIYSHLAKHPDIYMSPNKEPNFFGSDLHFQKTRITKDSYLALFENSSSYKYRGEASVSYLLSKTAAKEIKDFSPEAKIIIMLRNPVDVMYARYFQNRKFAVEPASTFEKALEKEELRRKGKDIPKEAAIAEMLFYREWVNYTNQMEQYVKVFGWENTFVGILDDLKEQPFDFLHQLGSFLSVTGLAEISMEATNKNTIVRSHFLNRIVRGQVEYVKPLGRALLPSRNLRANLKKALSNYNLKTASRKPLDPNLTKKLKKELTSEIENLSSFLNRDLTHWTE